MKRYIKILLSLVFSFSFVLQSCSNSNDSSTQSSNPIINSDSETSDSSLSHEHTFSNSYEYDDTYHWYPSTCGHNIQGDKERHTFNEEVTEPTYETGGYTTYTCSVCGYSYTDDNTDKLEHHYSNEWSHDSSTHWHACIDEGYEDLRKNESSHKFVEEVIDPTYEHGGYTTYTCSVCGYSYADDETDALPITITWENYDGTILEVDSNVPYGSMPNYDGETPRRESPSDYIYIFNGWDKELKPAESDVVYKAQYDVIYNSFNPTDFKYSIIESNNDKYITIDGYIGINVDVVIPDYISIEDEDVVVKEISSSAFKNNDLISSVIIPDCVESIGNNAFNQCIKLSSVHLGENSKLKKIGAFAFANCILLKNMSLTRNINFIDEYAFSYCYSLKAVITKENNKLTYISRGAFNECKSLTSITIPSSVKTIAYGAFSNCSSLINVTFEDKSQLKEINDNSFFECTALETIIIPDVVTTIGSQVFSGCSKLTNITFSNNSQLTTVGGSAFYNCSSLTSIIIPDNVISIGNYAFRQCSNLKFVLLGSSAESNLVTLGTGVFYNCVSLKSITIPESVVKIGSMAFYNCSSLTIYCEFSSIPNAWESDWNYSNCKVEWVGGNIVVEDNFAYVVYKSGNEKYIKISRYLGNDKDVIIPKTIKVEGEGILVTAIGNKAFSNLNFITSISIPDSVITIGSQSFDGCSKLATVSIDENSQLTSIGSYAFDDCSSLTSITIPDSVTTIGSYAFDGCSSLTSITIPRWEETFSIVVLISLSIVKHLLSLLDGILIGTILVVKLCGML